MTSLRRSRLRAASILFLLVSTSVLGAPPVALGHAELDTIIPADKTTVLGEPPSEIVATFTQHLDPAKSSLRLVDSGNAVIAEGSTVDTDRLTMRLSVPATLAPGVYTVRWTSFSTDDGESDRGTTTFTLTAPTPPPSVAPTAAPSVAVTPSASPSALPSVAPAPSPSPPPTAPVASTADALIPIVVVVLALLGLGLWLLRGRARRAG
jgi:methionine-rich copper-binding protein CopC